MKKIDQAQVSIKTNPMQLDPSLFALGGVTAIIAASWSQVKLAISQVRSLIVVKGHLSAGLNSYVSQYLRREWKQLPTSDVNYGVSYITLGTDLVARMIVFRMPPYRVAVFYKGWRVVVLLENEILMTLRGMVDLDELALKGVELYYEFMSATKRPNRYMKFDILGRDEKQNGLRSRGGSGDIDSGNRAAPPNLGREPDPQFDKPLGFTREQVLNLKVKPDPFETLVYDDAVMSHVSQAEQWFDRRDWYISKGIPWRRGWQLVGPPGTGKSRLCRALAEKLQIPIYSFHLNTLSDQEFMDEWRSLAMPCIVVFEDFDNVFDGRINVKESCTLSFDCVLNQISGIGTNDGLFLIVTTNHPEKIDPAMGTIEKVGGDEEGLSSRPGRIDVSLYLGHIDMVGKQRMASRILEDWPESVERLAKNEAPLTAAQFEELCKREALKQLALEEKAALLV